MRIGKFYIAEQAVINDQGIGRMLAALEFVPTKVTFDHRYGVFQMVGLSPKFDDIKLSNGVPAYSLCIQTANLRDYEMVPIRIPFARERVPGQIVLDGSESAAKLASEGE